jgi:hypothetical protein
MSFRRAKSSETVKRNAWVEWIALHRTALQAIGLSSEVYLSEAHWKDFLENGYLEWHPQDGTGFVFDRLSPASAGALRRFLEGQYGDANYCPPLLGWFAQVQDYVRNLHSRYKYVEVGSYLGGTLTPALLDERLEEKGVCLFHDSSLLTSGLENVCTFLAYQGRQHHFIAFEGSSVAALFLDHTAETLPKPFLASARDWKTYKKVSNDELLRTAIAHRLAITWTIKNTPVLCGD